MSEWRPPPIGVGRWQSEHGPAGDDDDTGPVTAIQGHVEDESAGFYRSELPRRADRAPRARRRIDPSAVEHLMYIAWIGLGLLLFLLMDIYMIRTDLGL